MSILVLGIGNILLSDEGIGVRVVERLQQFYEIPEGVEVMDGGTAGMELSAHLSRRQHVILIDAVKTGDPEGTVVELYDEQVPNLFRTHISPHQLGISDVLGILSITDELPEHFTLYGAVPYSIDTSSKLSLGFAPVLDDIVARVVARLAELGYPLTKRREPLAVFDPTMMVV
jgi:hydrogenase maturation protease